MSTASLKIAVVSFGLMVLFFLGALWAGCAQPQPDDVEVEVGDITVALTTCQSRAVQQFVNDVNLSWAMQSCNWNATSAAGRKEGFCLGFNGTKYDWTFEPSTGSSYGGFVYGHRQLVGRTDWLTIPGAFANGLSGSCACGKPCLYYVDLLEAQ